MRLYNMVSISMKNIYAMKGLILIGGIYAIIIIYNLEVVAKTTVPVQKGIFDVIAPLNSPTGGVNQYMFMFIAIPFLVTVLTQIMERNEQSLYVVKYNSRFYVWHVHVVTALLLSLFFTLFVLGSSYLIGTFLVSSENTWIYTSGWLSESIDNPELFQMVIPHVSSSKILTTLFVNVFLGALLISLSTLFLKQWIKSGAIIFVIIFSLAALDRTNLFLFPFFTKSISLNIENWIQPMTTVYHCGYVILISLVMYSVTGWLYERKDFFL